VTVRRQRHRATTRRSARADVEIVDTSVELGPVSLPNPIIAASGTFGHGDELADLCDPAGLGAVTTKSVAAFPWPGNPARRVTATAGGMLNAVGLPGPGVEAWIARDLPALEVRGARVIASIWGRTVDDYADAARALASVAHRLVALEVNLSCPNVEARLDVFAHSPESTHAAIAAVVDAAGPGLPVFAKLSPNVTDIVAIARRAVDAGATGCTLINTVMGFAIDAESRTPVLERGGGLSGAPIKPIALRAVWEVAHALPGVPIIGTGGVHDGRDAVEMMLAGAHAVGVGTATFADPRAAMRIASEVAQWCAAHGVGKVRELTRGRASPCQT